MSLRERATEIGVSTALALGTLAATLNQYEMDQLPEIAGGAEANAITEDPGGSIHVAGRAVSANGVWRAVHWSRNVIGDWEITTSHPVPKCRRTVSTIPATGPSPSAMSTNKSPGCNRSITRSVWASVTA